MPPDAPRDRYTQSDADFLAKLGEGKTWEEVVANRLRALGHVVEVDNAGVRRVYRDRRRHRDQDLWLPEIRGGVRVAVKAKRERFGPDPLAFPFAEVIVMGCRAWGHLDPAPAATVLISQLTGDAVVIPTSSRRHWTPGKVVNRREGIEQTVLFCPRDHLRSWEEFTIWLDWRPA